MYAMVGPYRFSGSDVRKTLHHALDLLALYPPATRAVQAPRRARVEALLDGVDPFRGDADTLVPLLERVWPELMSARDDLVAARALPATAAGSVAQLNVSDGGLPKRAIGEVEVDFGGVVGDRQATRVHHGRPFQALCLWNTESIQALVADGHPIGAGSAGENITMSGVAWGDVRPGVRLAIGGVLCEISCFAVPCKQNARWFSDEDFTRIHHENGPYSRVYATVLEPGVISVGDAAVVEPV